jgi:hypothetical protein
MPARRHPPSALIAEIMALPRKERMPSAKVLGDRLQVTNAERERIGIRTMLPFDRTKPQLEEQRKAKARAKAQRRRLKRGGRTREAYLATFRQRSKPWEFAGMSKATWYRRKARAGDDKAGSETGSVPTPETGETGSVPDKSLCMGHEPSLTPIEVLANERTRPGALALPAADARRRLHPRHAGRSPRTRRVCVGRGKPTRESELNTSASHTLWRSSLASLRSSIF